MAPLAIRAQGITRLYGQRLALHDLSLEVPAGGVFGLLGPNGSGKSTFIAMLAAMEQPHTGTLEVFGETPGPGLRKRTGTVFQENTADPLMTPLEYLRFAGRLFGVSRTLIEERGRALLKQFGLGDRAGDRVAGLSGGMRRRLEVARALLHGPELLLLDEPTTGVDAEERLLLWESLRAAGPDMTVLLATNDLAEADEVAGCVAFLREGTVVAAGTPNELKAGLRRESVRVTWNQPSGMVPPLPDALGSEGEVAHDGGVTIFTVDDAATFVPRLFEVARGAVRSVSIAKASLEDAYFQHVGRRSRESDG